jgi:hypothetical protein
MNHFKVRSASHKSLRIPGIYCCRRSAHSGDLSPSGPQFDSCGVPLHDTACALLLLLLSSSSSSFLVTGFLSSLVLLLLSQW